MLDVKKFRNILILVLVALLFVLYAIIPEVSKSKGLSLVFLDVGQGDAILVTSPTGKRVLVDAGKYPDIDSHISKYLPFYEKYIDLIIATHPDLDHIGGMSRLFERYTIGMFLHSGLLAGSSHYKFLAEKIGENKTESISAIPGQIIDIGGGAYFQVLAPHSTLDSLDPNDYSISLRLVYGDTSLLLTGDAGVISEHRLTSLYGDSLESGILKLGHHGSKTSSSPHFLDVVNPDFAIVSASCNNSYGHPHEVVIKRVESRSIELLETCNHGDIVFHSNMIQWSLIE